MFRFDSGTFYPVLQWAIFASSSPFGRSRRGAKQLFSIRVELLVNAELPVPDLHHILDIWQESCRILDRYLTAELLANLTV